MSCTTEHHRQQMQKIGQGSDLTKNGTSQQKGKKDKEKCYKRPTMTLRELL